MKSVNRNAIRSLLRFVEQFDKRVDPKGNIRYWQTNSEILAAYKGDDIDSITLKQGFHFSAFPLS
jgi:hypothetical protein